MLNLPHTPFGLPVSSCQKSSLKTLFVLVCLLLSGSFAFAEQPDYTDSRLLEMISGMPDTGAQWTILSTNQNSIRLELILPSLRVDDLNIDGQIWQALSIEHGGLAGEEGTPALPITGRLIPVPSNVIVNARITDYEVHEFKNIRLLPMQSESASEFQLDPATYSQSEWQTFIPSPDHQTLKAPGSQQMESDRIPAVFLGVPAIVAGQAVLPVTVGPVAYDPVSRTAMIASRVEIELSLDSTKSGAGLMSPTSLREQPGSAFRTLLQDQVAGISERSQNLLNDFDPGMWVVVCRDAAVKTHLDPLIDWRARQGYHVEVIITTGSAEAIKDELQVLYDNGSLPALEFILLAGDTESAFRVPTWYESLSGYDGEGDHYYTTLDGTDFLADAHVGRLSFTDLYMLDTIVNKITNYEQSPPVNNTDWFRKACVIGDPSDSGITTIYVNQWLKGQLLANNYAQVDTIWDGNYASQMMASVNAGVSAFGYRGFWNMSGISPGHIALLENGAHLPVAILPTCETGTFADSYTCHSEAWLRAPNGGAVAAIGTATGGTHTRYNNCYYQGVWNGLLNAGDPRIGVAHTLGKIELYNNYYLAEPETPEVWSVWNNIMGDGASQIWQSIPSDLTVDGPAWVSVGTSAIELTVEADGTPIADAMVCLYRSGEYRIIGRTDDSGVVLLATPPLTSGLIEVTVTGHDLIPYQGTISVGSANLYCGLTDQQIDDDSQGRSNGNGDSLINPGETIELSLAVTNHGTNTAFAVLGELTGGEPWSVIDMPTCGFGDVTSGSTVWANAPAVVSIDPAAPDGTTISWPLWSTDGNESWPSVAQAVVHAAALSVGDLDWSAGASFEPGQSGQLTMDLFNGGSIGADATSAVLSSSSPWIQITDNSSWFGNIAVESNGTNVADPFQFEIDSTCHSGHLITFQMAIEYNNGMQNITEFSITAGTAADDDPTGPDTYGYYAFDNTDVENYFSPTYDWVALDPDHGGPGLDVGLDDFGWEEDDTKTMDLPFTFRYYGVDFNEVSICSNGWLAMGHTPLVHYRNFSIPSAGSPGSLIAPFWDNLIQAHTTRVYHHYDEVGHRYIIQWYMLTNHYSNASQNFEVILLDPDWYPTATGDGMIIFQYETVSNTDNRDGYATVGIQNHDRSDGVLYSYWNEYAAGAAPLESGRAILFQPLGEIQLPVPSVLPLGFNESVEPGQSAQQMLHITNSGPAGSLLNYRIETVDPVTLPPEGLMESDKSIQGSNMTFSTDIYTPGITMDIELVLNVVSVNGMLMMAHLQMPAGVTLNSGENLVTSTGSTLFWREQVGEGVVTSWDGIEGAYIYYLPDGSVASATLNVTFAPDLVGDLEFSYTLQDLGYWTPADQVDGVITMTNLVPSVTVLSPGSDTVAVLGEALDIEFFVENTSSLVDIAIQRQPEGSWENLASAVAANAGNWNWLVEGDPGPYAVIRVTDSQDQDLYDDSDIFVVSRNLDWAQLSQPEGVVEAGTTADIVLTIDAADLETGQYEALLRVETNSGDTFAIPIDLSVGSVSEVGEALPSAVTLLGNYPNPFNPSTTISFTLPREMPVTMDIYSARGMRLRRILEGQQDAGVHHVVWDGTDKNGQMVPSGVYLYRLATADGMLSGKVLLAK